MSDETEPADGSEGAGAPAGGHSDTTSTPAAPSPAPDAPPAPSVHAQIVARWFNERVASSPVARIADAADHIAAVLQDLVAILDEPGAGSFESSVTRWLRDCIDNSPVSRATEAINHLTAQIPALIAALEEGA